VAAAEAFVNREAEPTNVKCHRALGDTEPPGDLYASEPSGINPAHRVAGFAGRTLGPWSSSCHERMFVY